MTRKFAGRNGLTHLQWLNLAPHGLPEGFREWPGNYRHWDQGNPIGWAISCFLEEAKKHKGYKVSEPVPKEKVRETPKLKYLLPIAEIFKLEILQEYEAEDLTTGLPCLWIRSPGNGHQVRIYLDEYGRYLANNVIPGVPGKIIRTWPENTFKIDI